jgi:antitoxin PrlF
MALVLRSTPMATTVTSKGQVTIPKPVRERLGIQPGNAVDFELAADGRVVLIKVDGQRRVSRFEALRGRAGAGLTTDEIMALTRGEDEA